MEFRQFPKIPRLAREAIITEKIDGTNASIHITEEGEFLVGSRTRFIQVGDDNFGFAAWAYAHKEELMQLGVGSHYGEWYGKKIGRVYDMSERRFALFNVSRWHSIFNGRKSNEITQPTDTMHSCIEVPICQVVPILHVGVFSTEVVDSVLSALKIAGSIMVPGYKNPEGVVVFHTASGALFKKTIEKDEGKGG